MLCTVRIWGTSCYETRRVNGIALILVVVGLRPNGLHGASRYVRILNEAGVCRPMIFI